jgi:hypothetical protein
MAYREALITEAVQADAELIGFSGQHEVRGAAGDYLQPYVYLSHRLVEMRAAGWDKVDFETIAAVSGASALFAFQPDAFLPKYAHLQIDLDGPIVDATGFGYEWLDIDGVDDAWQTVVESVDRRRALSGHDWENILFVGYRDAALPAEREVYAIADGPEYYSRWTSWEEFGGWVERVTRWGCPRLGRHTGEVRTQSARQVALGVMEKLVEWSASPPQSVRDEYPEATFGLAGIGVFADYLASLEPQDDWVACHPINPQWTVRNATGVYLERLVDDAVFSDPVKQHLAEAATEYRAAFDCWQAAYAIFGHGTTERARCERARRAALVALVRAWLAHEEHAVAAVADARAAA